MSMKIATVEEAAVVAQIVGNEVKGVSVLREKGHLKDSAGVIEEMNLWHHNIAQKVANKWSFNYLSEMFC